MAEIRGEQRQLCLNIGALTVPTQNAMHRESPSQIVQSGPSPEIAPDHDVRLTHDAPEGPTDLRVRVAPPERVDEERVVGPDDHGCLRTGHEIDAELISQAVRERHPARLEELALVDPEGATVEVHIPDAETQSFTYTQPCPVQHQK